MTALAGRVAIVTGASSGIGAATVRRFAGEGAHVYAVARRHYRLDALAADCPGVVAAPCDLGDPDAIAALVADIAAAEPRIDILVNNAGFSFYERHDTSTIEQWRETQRVNVEAMYLLAKGVVPVMAAASHGRIVNVSSVQAIASEINVGAYAASKGAIDAWSRTLAVDLADQGILVNVVAPGAIATEMAVVDGVDLFDDPDFVEWYCRRRKIPLGRPGTAEEVANAILFLAGDQCGYITGQKLVVDGGLTITF